MPLAVAGVALTTCAFAAGDFAMAIIRPLLVIFRRVIGGTFCSFASAAVVVVVTLRLMK